MKWAQLLWILARLQLKTALEYRLTFVLQVIFIFFNSCFTLSFWFIFFNRFNEVNGWDLRHTLSLQAMTQLAYSLSLIVFGGAAEISRHVAEGSLDRFLTQPCHTLLLCLTSHMRLYIWGDFLYGLLLLFLAGIDAMGFIRFLVLSCCGAFVFTSFLVLTHSLSFFLGDAQKLGNQARSALITVALYPPSLYTGVANIVVYSLIPAGFVTFLPLHLFLAFDIGAFLVLLGVVALFGTAAITFFRWGLKRYTSGNAFTLAD